MKWRPKKSPWSKEDYIYVHKAINNSSYSSSIPIKVKRFSLQNPIFKGCRSRRWCCRKDEFIDTLCKKGISK